ncbi:lysophospholipid acyltransferase family protein [Gaetbulibacter sp. PBL-D1]|uniref:lysophospholipid acyltransferase family protein n=1 Tax=Gaetbulibacter sp. PBL-D1 TaxID=3422594 RepID=UPI003D2EEC9B
MKILWLHTVRAYLSLGLFFYFKTIKVVHAENVPKNGAVLFLGNHQNALLDALLIAVKSGRFSYFLTRASVFKNKVIASILKSLLMLPVYRVRDGWSNISKNNSVFSMCANLLNKGEAITVFPEGSHSLKRRVRPLSKGFTRMVFEALKHNPELQVKMLPVGFNYSNPTRFGSSVSLNFGAPILVTSEVMKNVDESTKTLKTKVFNQLCELTTHIPEANYENDIKTLNDLQVDFIQPTSVNACIASHFENCKPAKPNRFSIFKSFFKLFLIIHLFPPYLIWKFVIQPKIKEAEFIDTFRFAIAITLVPMYMVIVVVLLSMLSFKLAISWFLFVLGIALFSAKL